MSILAAVRPGVGAGGAGGGGHTMGQQKAKKELAIEFINAIRTMDPQVLNALSVREAGEELAQFFLTYASSLTSRDPAKVLENTSSLMRMGYLSRQNEERKRPAAGLPQPHALA